MTTYSPEYAGLLATVLAEPGEDAPRLVLADFLEENGEAERSEFIRVQVATGEPCEVWVCGCGCGRLAYGRTGLEARGECPAWMAADLRLAAPGRVPSDKRQNYNLRTTYRRGFVASVRCRLSDWVGQTCDGCDGTGRDAALPDDDWTCPSCQGKGRTPAHGPAIVRQHPIERVEIVDAVPLDGSDFHPDTDPPTPLFVWVKQTDPRNLEWEVPSEVYRHLTDDGYYPSEANARADLSAALLAWARAEANA